MVLQMSKTTKASFSLLRTTSTPSIELSKAASTPPCNNTKSSMPNPFGTIPQTFLSRHNASRASVRLQPVQLFAAAAKSHKVSVTAVKNLVVAILINGDDIENFLKATQLLAASHLERAMAYGYFALMMHTT
ncbi:hypothetical protein SMMN14_03149 [Sphaerulina musiva]